MNDTECKGKQTFLTGNIIEKINMVNKLMEINIERLEGLGEKLIGGYSNDIHEGKEVTELVKNLFTDDSAVGKINEGLELMLYRSTKLEKVIDFLEKL